MKAVGTFENFEKRCPLIVLFFAVELIFLSPATSPPVSQITRFKVARLDFLGGIPPPPE